MAVIWNWSMTQLIKTIVCTLLNKFDFFLVVDGGTGIGKSTLSVGIATRVKREFSRLRKLEIKSVEYYYERLKLKEKGISEEEFIKKLMDFDKEHAYGFTFKTGLIYNQTEMQDLLNKWHTIGICDELITTLFNRDFYSTEQKNIIKLTNISRDHSNLVILCIPNFSSMDTQMKGLCKMRITVVRRGLGVIQCPTRSLYNKDHWNMAFNEKQEKSFKNMKRPNYSRLTTFRGLLRFNKLHDSIEAKYQIVKDEKRGQIVNEEMGMKKKGEDKDIVDRTIDQLTSNGIRNMNVIEGIAIGNGMTLTQFRAKISRRLQKAGKNSVLKTYFWDHKTKDVSEFKDYM